MQEIVKEWNEKYFGGQLSQECLTELNKVDSEYTELVDFIDTQLYYYHLSHGRSKNFSPLAARFYATIAKSYMPSMWEKIPPITHEGRLKIIDQIAQSVLNIPPNQSISFLDIGCGYPPVTTVETSDTYPKWMCIGIDPNFPDYILFDKQKVGACFDEKGTLSFIQYRWSDENIIQPEPARLEEDKRKFALEWQKIQADGTLKDKLKRENRLLVNPIEQFERSNLKFHKSTLLDLEIDHTFDCIRCMNVFMYFDKQVLLESMSKAKDILNETGFFIFGSVIDLGYAAKYTVYQKLGDTFIPRFFGLDLGKFSQREGNGWWAFSKDQPDTLFLAKIVSMIADNHALFGKLTNIIDEVEHTLGYSYRDQNGFYHAKNFINLTKDYDSLNKKIAKECKDDIISFLESIGISASVTPFWHLVIDLSHSKREYFEQYFPTL